MKPFFLLCAVATLSFSSIGIAEIDPHVKAQTSSSPRPDIEVRKASKVLDMEVHNTKEQLGEVEDMMLNPRSGRVLYVVVSTGGWLGLGDKLVAVPPTALNPAGDGKRLILEADKASLRAAPSFQENNWPEMADTGWLSEHDRHYAKNVEQAIEEASGAERPAQTEPKATAESPKFVPPENIKLSDLLERDIRGDHNDTIGEIEDAAIDLQTGEIRYLVVELEEEDNKFVAIAPQALRQQKGAKHLIAPHSASHFETAVRFDANNWPTQPRDIIGTAEEPAGTPVDPKSDGRTALDQSNARRDLMITQQLRRAIMKDPRMSTLTRNITIITADGVITVRGTVASQTEADRIVAFAREIAGNEVVNELKIRNPERKAQ